MNSILNFLSSLTFLYLFAILLLLWFGMAYYRNFERNGREKRFFPWVFTAITAACFFFLYTNMHAPLRMQAYSNLDHHFIRHDGFRIKGTIQLGSFSLSKQNGSVYVSAVNSEEPFYIIKDGKYKLASANYPAKNKSLQFSNGDSAFQIFTNDKEGFELKTGGNIIAHSGRNISKGMAAWNIFRDDSAFMNSSWFTDEKLINALRNIYLLRDNVSKDEKGELKYFISGKPFNAIIPDKSSIGWGLGIWDNSRNQFHVSYRSADSFDLINRYPVSYPLTEEKKNGSAGIGEPHRVDKFLVSDARQLGEMPAVFTEGFLFPALADDSTMYFSPILLSYLKDRSGSSLNISSHYLNGSTRSDNIKGDHLILPARSGNFGWIFSIQNSFTWKLGSWKLSAVQWQLLIFGTLFLFYLVIMLNTLLKSHSRLSWVWQLLSCITILLLTTRFFLYWRYKSFPPYESMDAPSLQQLNSFWNFGVIIVATLLLTLVFGAGLFRKQRKIRFQPISMFRKIHPRNLFIVAWLFVLLSGAALAVLGDFEPSVCRHLAIGLILFYFLFIYISYRHSPLVVSAEKKWWDLHTGRPLDIIFNNPVKVLLSLSLLGLFGFIDTGFAIVFLNFILFNEAFLCINYAIAGLSAGSRRNARLFGWLGTIYLLVFVVNLIAGPYIFKFLLEMPSAFYLIACLLFAAVISYAIIRLGHQQDWKRKFRMGIALTIILTGSVFLLFPRQKIMDKAAVTKYRIDVMTVPVDRALEKAYADGKSWEPVIRAAQNQWFINTFIYEKNNPAVNSSGFHLLPHSPQNKGAKYNAQTTDLVTSRFLIAEHGRWPVLFFVLILIIPSILLASIYKLYPDFTNRINEGYPVITTGFALLNYLSVTALLVILAATGRYIFFGQDLPFGSILSKQSILFPSFLIIILIFLFQHITPERYPNRKKFVPGIIIFSGLGILLFLVKPAFNKEKEFTVPDLAKDMDSYIQLRIQPVLDEIDSSADSRKLSMVQKDRLFTERIRQLLTAGAFSDAGHFLQKELAVYSHQSFSKHLDDSRLLYLDLHNGNPELEVNENYFRVEAPPHLQQLWTGNVYGDSSNYNITIWTPSTGELQTKRVSSYSNEPIVEMGIRLKNPGKWTTIDANGREVIIAVQPDAFMKNLYVNGGRYYTYPLGSDFIWARNFAETVSVNFSDKASTDKNIFLSLDAELTDSLLTGIKRFLQNDTTYHSKAEYGICIADAEGRLIAIPDWIKGLERPDPNDRIAFNTAMRGENGMIPQSRLRKLAGNINLLRMNPGPGSTLKPIIFSAIASQLPLNWDAFAAEGFNAKQQYFGGEKVAEYDFEKNNGRITNVADYLKYSDNYYHADLLLLGSYNRQSLQNLLFRHFQKKNPEQGVHWPYFSYNGQQYWLNGFENWPGYMNGKANFGSDSSFVSIGLYNNYNIYTARKEASPERYRSSYDSMILRDAWKRSGFILPEFSLFDQKGSGMNMSRPNEVFLSSFRGHVKGSSQVMIPPVKMLDAFGKLVSQDRNYSLTLDPYATSKSFAPFYVDNGVEYSSFLELMKGSVFKGMRDALFSGTAARLGSQLKNGSPYYYFAKTGTTGSEEAKVKSKLFVLIISEKDLSDPSFNFRKNKFFTIYFTSQNGPAIQNEAFQKEIIKMVENSPVFKRYMNR